MDHIWNSLYNWKRIWEDRINDEMKKPDYEGKDLEIKMLRKDVEAIEKAMKEIHKRF